MSGHSKIVHRSLLTRDLMAGIPQNGLLLLIVLGIIFTYGLEMYFMLVPIAALYGIMRFLTKKDPWFVDIVLENIMQKDRFIP
jgi:type IV secretory pathway VirB3-like protein